MLVLISSEIFRIKPSPDTFPTNEAIISTSCCVSNTSVMGLNPVGSPCVTLLSGYAPRYFAEIPAGLTFLRLNYLLILQ